MKLQENTDTVETSSTQVGNFNIKASALAARILSSKIYTDKILAVIREVSTNAADAQLEVGKSLSDIEIHLPSHFEPYFSVKDQGPGLSKLQTTTVFSTYFESTKSSDNKAQGGFGLGAKSPFAYTSNFSIKTCKDGVECVFSAFMSNDSFPQIALLSETPTESPNGVEVIVPVESKDINEFHNTAKSYFRIWEPAPKFNDLHVQKYVESNQISGSIFTDKCYYGKMPTQVSKFFVVMGRNMLEFDQHKIQSKIKNQAEFNAMCNSYEGNVFGITVDIGEIDIAVSRESVEYTDKTNQVLAGYIDRFVDNAKNNLEAGFNNCTTLWEAMELLNNPVAPFLRGTSVATLKAKFPDYKGSLIIGTRHLSEIPLFEALILNSRTRKESISKSFSFATSAGIKLKFYVQDVKSQHNALRRLEEAGLHFRNVDCNYLITPAVQAMLQADYGIPDSYFTLCSTFAEPVKIKNFTKYPKNLYMLSGTGRWSVRSNIDAAAMIAAASNVYYCISDRKDYAVKIVCKDDHVVKIDSKYSNNYAGHNWHHLMQPNDILVFVPQSNKGCVEDSWILLDTLVQQAYEDSIPLQALRSEHSKIRDTVTNLWQVQKFGRHCKYLNSLFAKFDELEQKVKKINVNAVEFIANHVVFEEVKVHPNYEQMSNNFLIKYPLVQHISQYAQCDSAVKSYIAAIDFMQEGNVNSSLKVAINEEPELEAIF